jgi:hypothetical protein
MRWQRLSVTQSIKSGDWRTVWSVTAPALAMAACVVMGAATLFLTSARLAAAADDIVEGGDVISDSAMREPGMPSSNPRVKSLLSAHPNDFVTICVAGCDGKPAVVQMLPKPVEKRVGGMRTTAAGAGRSGATFPAADRDSVICVAGCLGKSGEAVQRLPGLPMPKAAPAPRDMEEGNEPLEVQ